MSTRTFTPRSAAASRVDSTSRPLSSAWNSKVERMISRWAAPMSRSRQSRASELPSTQATRSLPGAAA